MTAPAPDRPGSARDRLAVVAVAAALVLTGCSVPIAGPGEDAFGTDRELGQIGDYRYDDVYEFDGNDALTGTQLEVATYRAMARIEVLRGLHFRENVEVDVVEREAFREERGERADASAFENEVWRGAFVVDGETDVNVAFEDVYGESVVGYYAGGRIVLVVPDADEVRVDRTTLVHELVHALQDQRFDLAREGETIDELRAENGLVEGEANYVPTLYDEWCREEWECLPDRRGEPRQLERESGAEPFNVGLFLSIYAPYSAGPAFVEHLHENGGWAAVDDAHEARPTSTSQLLHPERYPDDEPVDVDVADRSGSAWERYTAAGEEGDDGTEERAETVGEATLFATLWANGAIDRGLAEGGTDLSPYNYSHPATDGWAGDAFVVYERDGGEAHAHVWELAWNSAGDAEAFADAYRDLLATHDATELEEGTYRIDDGGFEGAYRVETAGERVTIVGAPHVEDLAEVHAPAEAEAVAEEPSIAAPGPVAGAAGSHGATIAG